MKKITLIAAFSFFLAVAAYAQTDNKDNSATPASFQRIESTIQPKQAAVTSQTVTNQAAATKGQNQTAKMVTDAASNTAPGTIQKVSSKANTAKTQQSTTAPQSGAVQNAITPAGSPKQ